MKSRSSADDWKGYAKTHTAGHASFDTIRTTKSVHDVDKGLIAANITVREARDSDVNPLSTPIILALDGTGSMSRVITAAIKSFGTLMVEVYDRKPVTDPCIAAMFFDDIAAGAMPALQVTQFESDTKVADQFRGMHPVGAGGGNDSESYHLPLYFAAYKTSCDAFTKRGKKGYLFTVGDEKVPGPLTIDQVRRVFGPDESVHGDLSYQALLEACRPNWEVFHIMVEQGDYMMSFRQEVIESWTTVLGQRAIPLSNIEDLTAVVIATIEVNEGRDRDAVVKSFSDSTSVTVAHAIGALTKGSDGNDVVRL